MTEENIEAEWIDISEILTRNDLTFYHEYIYRKILVDLEIFNITLRFCDSNPLLELIEKPLY